MIPACSVPPGSTVWHPYGDDPGILTGVTVTGPAGDGMVDLTADQLGEPLRLAGDWPIDLTASSPAGERMSP